MDFSFHEKVLCISSNNKGPSLKEIGAHLFRGSFSRKALSEKLGEGNFFHLNNFNNTKSHFVTMSGTVLSKAARTGDILVARVGKRSVGKIALVQSGEFEVSDCIIVIRVPTHWRIKVFNSLLSGKGKTWISAYSHGVCSKFISQKDLYDFTVTP